MEKASIPQLAKGFVSSEFFVILLVVMGVDVDTAVAIFGGVPDAEQIKAVIAMLHGEDWQSLLIKSGIAAGYLWVRHNNKMAGINFEIERIRSAVERYDTGLQHTDDLTKLHSFGDKQ